MYTYLKKTLFSLLIIMMTMNIASKAMDTEECDRSTVSARKIRVIEKNQNDVTSFTRRSTSSQILSVEDSQRSLASYLLSPAMRAAQSAYNILDYTIRNPQKAMMIGIFLACQASSVAAQIPPPPSSVMCFCYCKNNITGEERYYAPTFIAPPAHTCLDLCPTIKGYWVFSRCEY